MLRVRTYSELCLFNTFEERFEYLKLDGSVGKSTFGFDRWVNQKFYHSIEWRLVKNQVIIRDNGCDLGIPGFEIHAELLIHHMNPMSVDDIIHGEDWILDPENLICTSFRTHNAIHYGNKSLLPRGPIERR